MAGTAISIPSAPTRAQRLRLSACLALIALPHVAHLPLWVSALAATLLIWQIAATWQERPLPGRLARFALAAVAFSLVLAGFGQVNGPEAGISLLLLMLALKLCELHSHRDAMVFLALLAFLLITQFLFSQSLAMALYLVAGTWLITAAFVDNGTGGSLSTALGDSARLLCQALPLAAVLFVLFPRIPGPLWELPENAGTRARMGLSEQMTPGSISRLATSDAVALRVRFPEGAPPPEARYWRGPVLWNYARGTWSRGHVAGVLPAADIQPRDDRVWRSEITLESSHHDWLIGLDVPLSSSHDSTQGAGATFNVAKDIDQRIRYTVRSALVYTLDAALPAATARRATRLPGDDNPRARALAQRWRDQGMAPAAIVGAALRMFRQRPFSYTLDPQRTSRADSIDDFLFDSRKGFCEHYAGAFTFLMRAAGIPARVVTGYQGGERSIVGDYWVVRNSDAHAWSEVWLAGRGWRRIDPTAAVAPERIESGIAASLVDTSPLPYMARAGGAAWYQMKMLWDGVNAAWNRWFLAYGPQLQRQVLDVLGLGGLRGALVALTICTVGLLGTLSVWLEWRLRRHPPIDRVIRAWQRICNRLAASGCPRAAHEGPRAYAERVAEARADLADEIRALAALYIRLRYAPAPRVAMEREFLERAARFRPSAWSFRRRPTA